MPGGPSKRAGRGRAKKAKKKTNRSVSVEYQLLMSGLHVLPMLSTVKCMHQALNAGARRRAIIISCATNYKVN